MKATLALSLLSLASTAFAGEVPKPEEPVVARQTTPADDLINRRSAPNYQLAFLLEDKLATASKDKVALTPEGYKAALAKLVEESKEKMQETIEAIVKMLDTKHDELYKILGPGKKDAASPHLTTAIRTLAADANKYHEYMKLARKHMNEKSVPSDKEIDAVLGIKCSPAIEATSSYFPWTYKYELSQGDKNMLKNRLISFCERYAYAKNNSGKLEAILKDKGLSVEGDQAFTFATQLNHAEYHKVKGDPKNNEQKQTGYMTREVMIGGAAVVAIVVLVAAYVVIKRMGASAPEDELDV